MPSRFSNATFALNSGMDNLAPPDSRLRKAIEQAERWLLYLPPYSPPLSIEQAFSKLKAHRRKLGARTLTELFNALRASAVFTPAECWNYLQAAGYVAG
ncbi:hypothetical protein DPM13_17735 [Paracoccus mutanolyticus]|uniref:Tc1-like transposase DDE domain-containing protein n=1 Tax=Paracoccus mutanolyticus TaxID=1499308 RepID=A0ABM6WU25_9RHOB|nr:hypothetical protein DPM13_17735 [Paracoccus mutanolyticus]